MRAKHNLQLSITTFAFMLTLGACSQPLRHRERGALIGGGAGAAGGALIGGITGAPGTGALIGGAAGAIGGGLLGDEQDRRRRND